MLQSTPCRVLTATAFSLIITILMYATLNNVEIRSSSHQEVFKPTITSAWGDGWASMLPPGDPLEEMTIRSPSGQYFFGMEKDGRLIFQNRVLNKNTTFFSPDEKGEHGIGPGVTVPEDVSWHAVLTKRGVLAVYYLRRPAPPPPPAPEPSAEPTEQAVPTPAPTASAQVEGKRQEAVELGEDNGNDDSNDNNDNDDTEDDDDSDDEETERSPFTVSIVWDSNRLPNCHTLPKYAPARSAPFLELDNTGFLQISTSNEINCILMNPEEERASSAALSQDSSNGDIQ